MAVVTEIDGKLAIDMGWITDWQEPVREHLYYVAPKIPAERVRELFGLQPEFTGNMARVWLPGRLFMFDLDDKETWEKVLHKERIRKPRRGKYYDWAWSMGRWIKVGREEA